MSYAIDSFGYPLGFKVNETAAHSNLTLNKIGREIIKVEACHLIGKQYLPREEDIHGD